MSGEYTNYEKLSNNRYKIDAVGSEDIAAYARTMRTVIAESPHYTDEEKQTELEKRTEGYYRQKLTDPNATLLAAKNEQGEIIGVLEGNIVETNRFGKVGHISWTNVTAENREQGIGTALKTRYEKVLKEKGIQYVRTFIKTSNMPSRLMNYTLGYKLTGAPSHEGRTYMKEIT